MASFLSFVEWVLASFDKDTADRTSDPWEKITRQRYLALREDKDYLHSVIPEGAIKVQVRADTMLSQVYRTVGFLKKTNLPHGFSYRRISLQKYSRSRVS
jgi:hypothetical protein